MKSVTYVLLLIVGAAALSSCTGPRYAASAEYDDAYFTQADIAAPVAVETSTSDRYEDRMDQQQSPRTYRQPVDSYQDAYYEDDDFTFSRRIRRFNNVGAASWRYYDPFFANDLYYVMGTPAWNRWNNNGWYNWNAPRFGATPGWNDPFFNPYANPYNGWGAFGPGFNRNPFAFDPWVNSYYGYGAGAGFGSPFFNPGFGGGLGYGAGFGGAYYCPPVGFVNSTSNWRRVNNAQQSYVTRRRTTTQTTRPTTGTTSRQNIDRTRPATNNTRQARSSNYLEPRRRPATTTGRTAAPTRTNTRRNTARNNGTNTYTRPGRSNTSTNRNATTNTNRNNSRYNNSGRTNSNRNTRTTTRPSNSNRNTGSFNRSNSSRNNSSFNRSNSGRNNSSFNRSSSSRSSSSSSRSSGVRRR
ncbi:MAG: hypothetical protein AAF399_04045 [Bacteroidota bacterium]